MGMPPFAYSAGDIRATSRISMDSIWSGFIDVTFGFVIVTYMLIGALLGVFIAARGPKLAAESPTIALGLGRAGAALRTKWLGRVRLSLVMHVCVPLMCLTMWPSTHGDIALAFKRRPALEYDLRTRQSLVQPKRLVGELSALLFVLCAALAYSLAGPHWYVRGACYAAIIAAMSELLGNILAGSSLEEQLRREHRSPQLQFALITLANFAIVTVAAFVLTRWRPDSAFQFDDLTREGKDVISGAHLRSVWEERNAGATRILIAIASVLLYSLLLGRLKVVTRSRRSDEDRLALGLKCLWAGDRDGAERWLEPVRRKRGQVEAVRAELALAIAASDYDRALDYARVLSSMRTPSEKDSDADDDALVVLIATTHVLDGGRAASVLRYVIDHGMTDACLSYCVPWFLVARRLAGDSYTRAGIGEFGISDPPYPLTVVAIDYLFGDFGAAGERLKDYVPVRTTEDIVKRRMSSNISMDLVRDDRRGYVAAVHQAGAEFLEQIASHATSELPFWLVVILGGAARDLATATRESGDQETAKELERAFERLMGDQAKGASVLVEEYGRGMRRSARQSP
jgi:hypothetical protein